MDRERHKKVRERERAYRTCTRSLVYEKSGKINEFYEKKFFFLIFPVAVHDTHNIHYHIDIIINLNIHSS